MSTTTSAELSLINGAELHHERAGSDPVNAHGPDALLGPRPAFDDAFDALEIGLPRKDGAPATIEPFKQQEPYDDEPIAPAPPMERNIPFAAVALVIVLCLAAGAATAVLVFHARLTAITATRPASR